jgi:photosystem II stability/assembly factor-like uncharacterized protein
MTSGSATNPGRRPLSGILAFLLAVIALVWSQPARAADRPMSFFQEKAMWEEHFRQIPDIHAKGSGWKPYSRWLWFYGARVAEDGYVPVGARWNAYLAQQELIRENRDMLRTEAVWTNLGPINIAGRCQAIAFDPSNPSRMFVGSASGGLFESLDAGASWAPVDDNLPTLAVGAIAWDPNDANIVYMGTGEGNNNADAVFGVGVLRSTDGGLTWSPFGTGMEWQIGDGRAVNKLVINPVNGTIIAGTTVGIMRYAAGAWTQVLAGVGTGLLHHPTSPDVWYCALGRNSPSGANGVYQSTDDGLTWTKQTNGFPINHARLDIAICRDQPNVLYAGISNTNGTMLGIYKTTDGGTSWTLAYNTSNHYASQGWYDLIIGVDPTNPNKVYSGGLDLWTSVDGGTTFTRRTHWDFPPGHPQYVHADQHGFVFHPNDPAHVYAACDGGLFQSTDSGVNWQEISTGLTTMQFYDIDIAQTNLTTAAGGTQDNGSNVYSGTTTWSRALGGDGFHCNIDYAKPDTMYMEVYYGDHWRTYNGGASIGRINSGIGENGAWDTPVHIDYGNTAILYTAHRIIYKSTNRGSQWVGKTAALPGSGLTIAQSPSDFNYLYCGYSAPRNIHRSTDRGETWTPVSATGLPSRGITRLRVHPAIPTTVYATYSGFFTPNVWMSTDAGDTWSAIGGNLPALPVSAIEIDPLDPNVIYVGTDLGVWRTEDGGLLWLPYGQGLPNVVVADLRIQKAQRILAAGTYGRGLWEVPLQAAGASSVQESETAGSRVEILNVFPNPLASQDASVRFTLPREGRVRVQLFDASGRLIESPLDRDLPAGTHRVEWPTRASNGVYFVKIRQGMNVSSSKLTIRR